MPDKNCRVCIDPDATESDLKYHFCPQKIIKIKRDVNGVMIVTKRQLKELRIVARFEKSGNWRFYNYNSVNGNLQVRKLIRWTQPSKYELTADGWDVLAKHGGK